jgi:lipopolysaccharide biosynthesis regulator YciM
MGAFLWLLCIRIIWLPNVHSNISKTNVHSRSIALENYHSGLTWVDRDPQKAKEWFLLSMQNDVSIPEVHLSLGNVLLHDFNAPDEAMRCYENVLQLGNVTGNTTVMVSAYMAMGDLVSKNISTSQFLNVDTSFYEKALILDPYDVDAFNRLYGIGYQYYLQDHFDLAIKLFSSILTIKVDDVEARHMIGLCYINRYVISRYTVMIFKG